MSLCWEAPTPVTPSISSCSESTLSSGRTRTEKESAAAGGRPLPEEGSASGSPRRSKPLPTVLTKMHHGGQGLPAFSVSLSLSLSLPPGEEGVEPPCSIVSPSQSYPSIVSPSHVG